MAQDVRILKSKIGEVFDKWETAAENGRRDNQPLNDNVIPLIKSEIMAVLVEN